MNISTIYLICVAYYCMFFLHYIRMCEARVRVMFFWADDDETVEDFTINEDEDPFEDEEVHVFSAPPTSIHSLSIEECPWDNSQNAELDISNWDRTIYIQEG